MRDIEGVFITTVLIISRHHAVVDSRSCSHCLDTLVEPFRGAYV